MSPEHDDDPILAIADDEAVENLAPFYDARPARSAWRADVEAAPAGKPVYARELNSIRVVIAMHDEEGWVMIRRDGELRPIEAVSSWAPLEAAIG